MRTFKIKESAIALLILATLTGCGSFVSHYEIDESVYSVDARGGPLAPESSYLKNINKRADKLCPGGYDVIKEPKKNVDSVTAYSNGIPIEAPQIHYQSVIKCDPVSASE